MVTAPSGRISIHALGLNGSRATGACEPRGSTAGRYSPITRVAPAAAPVLRNSRRLTIAWLMSHLWSARSGQPTTGVTTPSITLAPDGYSAVKTSTGLIRAALKPGIEHESTAIAITTATASAIVAGSAARTPNRSEPNHRDSNADRARPIAEPKPAYRRPRPTTRRVSELGAAPRVSRTRSSCRRRYTAACRSDSPWDSRSPPRHDSPRPRAARWRSPRA